LLISMMSRELLMMVSMPSRSSAEIKEWSQEQVLVKSTWPNQFKNMPKPNLDLINTLSKDSVNPLKLSQELSLTTLV